MVSIHFFLVPEANRVDSHSDGELVVIESHQNVRTVGFWIDIDSYTAFHDGYKDCSCSWKIDIPMQNFLPTTVFHFIIFLIYALYVIQTLPYSHRCRPWSHTHQSSSHSTYPPIFPTNHPLSHISPTLRPYAKTKCWNLDNSPDPSPKHPSQNDTVLSPNTPDPRRCPSPVRIAL